MCAFDCNTVEGAERRLSPHSIIFIRLVKCNPDKNQSSSFIAMNIEGRPWWPKSCPRQSRFRVQPPTARSI
eukprot:4346516-Amphidinium_carterae.1